MKLEAAVDNVRERHDHLMDEHTQARRDTKTAIESMQKDLSKRIDATRDVIADMRVDVAKSSVVIGGIVVVASAAMSAVFRWILP